MSKHLKVPEDEDEGHVVYSDIDDEHEEEEPRSTIFFQLRKMWPSIHLKEFYRLMQHIG